MWPLCTFPLGGFSVRWGRNHNKPNTSTFQSRQQLCKNIASDIDWNVELQIAGANFFAAFNPEAVGNSSESAFSTVGNLVFMIAPVERVHYVQPCARRGEGKFYILFAAINPELAEIHQKVHFPRAKLSAPPLVEFTVQKSKINCAR